MSNTDNTATTQETENTAAPMVASNAQVANTPIDPAAGNTAAEQAPGAEPGTDSPEDVAPEPDCDEPSNPGLSAYEKLLQVAASVERAKFALGLKGFFDPAQTEIGGLIDEILQDVPFVDKTQPIWYREPDEATIERAAKAGFIAAKPDGETRTWEEIEELLRSSFRAMAEAVFAARRNIPENEA